MSDPPRRGRPPSPPDCSTAHGRFGAAIRAARLARGIEVKEAAESVGIDARTWYHYEAGDHFPPIPLLPVIAAVLGCEIGKLIPKRE